MSTNYYLVSFPEYDGHIGKQSAGHGFKWAMCPSAAEAHTKTALKCHTCGSICDKPIRDEYGRALTWKEFLDRISPEDTWSLALVGVQFS